MAKTTSTHNPLALGDGQAKTYRSSSAAEEDVMRMLPPLVRLRFTDSQDLSLRAAQVSIDKLVLSAIAISPSELQVRDPPDVGFVLPWIGAACLKREGRTMLSQSHKTAVLVPPGEGNYQVKGERHSVLVARLDPLRLQATVNTMLGPHGYQHKMSPFTKMKELPLQQGRFSFDAALRAIIAQINSYEGNTSILDLSGIDDVFYRTVALTLYPESFLEQSKRSPKTGSQRLISRACEYVMANLSKPITLTELERLAHMSRRALHNAFYRSFNQSPMEWVREQRLLAARALLRKPDGIQTVSQVLYACGFTNPSLFASLYLRRFGESPSVTLRRSFVGRSTDNFSP